LGQYLLPLGRKIALIINLKVTNRFYTSTLPNM
jgi:hypothetical protein